MRSLTQSTLSILSVAGIVAAFVACSTGATDDTTSPTASPDSGDSGAATAPGTLPMQGTPLSAEGAKFVASRNCAHCHQGDSSEGVLSGQSAAPPYGPNLTPDPITGLGTWSPDLIARALQKGVDDQNQPLCAPMPVFKDMTDHEALAIATYLQTLPAVQRTVPDACGDDPGPGPGPGPGPSDDDAGSMDDDAGSMDPDSGTPPVDAGPAADSATPPADAGDSGTCVGYASPTTAATCNGCGTHACQVNGCYNGYYCLLSNATCHAKPAACP